MSPSYGFLAFLFNDIDATSDLTLLSVDQLEPIVEGGKASTMNEVSLVRGVLPNKWQALGPHSM
jgi:hypothetical protein